MLRHMPGKEQLGAKMFLIAVSAFHIYYYENENIHKYYIEFI
jgi:hypothetical protein